jgi:hypothetical protein
MKAARREAGKTPRKTPVKCPICSGETQKKGENLQNNLNTKPETQLFIGIVV